MQSPLITCTQLKNYLEMPDKIYKYLENFWAEAKLEASLSTEASSKWLYTVVWYLTTENKVTTK